MSGHAQPRSRSGVAVVMYCVFTWHGPFSAAGEVPRIGNLQCNETGTYNRPRGGGGGGGGGGGRGVSWFDQLAVPAVWGF